MEDQVRVLRPSEVRRAGNLPVSVATHWADLLGVALYGVCTVIFFWRTVAQGMLPAGYDLLIYFYPYKAYVAELLRQGQLPLWNPLVYMGVPLLGNIQIGVLYPPNLLFYLLPAVDGLRSSILLHAFLAGLFAYLFARVSLRLSPPAAWVAGAVFAFGGFIGGRVGHLNVFQSAVWVPALLLCMEQAVSRKSVRLVVLGAATYTLQILAGHTQEVYYSGLVLGLFALYLTFFGGLSGPHRVWPLGVVASMAAGAAALSAVQLVPALELSRESYRFGGVPFAQAVTFSVPAPELFNSILPQYRYAPYIELAGYVAAASLALVPAALASRSRHGHQWFFAALALLALLLALGGWTPVYGWFYRVVPGFDLFRAPGRWLLLSNLSLALLAAIGVDSVGARLNESDLRGWLSRYALAMTVAVGAVVALQLWLGGQDKELYYSYPRAAFTWGLFGLTTIALSLLLCAQPHISPAKVGLVGLVLFELYLAKEPLEYNMPVDPALYTTPSPFAAQLSEDPSFRMLSLADEKYELPDQDQLRATLSQTMAKADVENRLRYTRLMRVTPPDVGMLFGFNSLDGSDGGMLPTRRWAELKQVLMGAKDYHPDLTMRIEEGQIPNSRTVGALGVRYLILNQDRTEYDSGWQVEGSTGPLKLLRNSAALPRAYVVHAAQTVSSDREALEAVKSADLTRTVVLDEQVGFQPPSESGRDRVEMIEDGPNEVVVNAVLDQPGFLVLSDSYYPGWKAYVDGQETTILRADYAVRAVQLSSGSHQVRFSFEPRSVMLGLAVTVLALLAAALLLLPRRLRRVPLLSKRESRA